MADRRRRTAGLAAAIVLVAAAGLALWLAHRGPSYAPVVAPSALESWTAPWSEPQPSASPAIAKKWIVVGWDGAGWDLALPLVAAGKMPHLEALMREGAYGPMSSFQPTWSPVLWTTVATGVTPKVHGILAWGRVEGGTTRRLFTNADRRVRALWNVMTEASRPSLIVGYHNTFPADRIRGLMVSNYLYHEHLEDRMDIHGAEPTGSGLVFPLDRLKEILEIQRDVTRALPEAMPRFASYPPELAREFSSPLGRALAPGEDQRKFFLKKAWLFDTISGRIVEAEHATVAPDLTMVHFQCIDFASHYFLYFHDPKRFASMPWPAGVRAALEAQQPLYAHTVEAFYRYADEWLGRLNALRDGDTGILLLSDHGFEPEQDAARTGNHASAPPGIFVVAGPGVKAGKRDRASLYDVMPTLAAVLRLPVADDLKGHPRRDWFDPVGWSKLSVRNVATYETGGRYVPDIPAPDATQRELMEQLRAIGYIR
jgi:predicted AlkP superfamily phosphohydrolase/phosphomutase